MTHDERVYHHLYETLEGIAEQSERIASLEELVLDVAECVRRLNDTSDDGGCVECPYISIEYDCDFDARMSALEVEP